MLAAETTQIPRCSKTISYRRPVESPFLRRLGTLRGEGFGLLKLVSVPSGFRKGS
jgi:hypothetical protein